MSFQGDGPVSGLVPDNIRCPSLSDRSVSVDSHRRIKSLKFNLSLPLKVNLSGRLVSCLQSTQRTSVGSVQATIYGLCQRKN